MKFSPDFLHFILNIGHESQRMKVKMCTLCDSLNEHLLMLFPDDKMGKNESYLFSSAYMRLNLATIELGTVSEVKVK